MNKLPNFIIMVCKDFAKNVTIWFFFQDQEETANLQRVNQSRVKYNFSEMNLLFLTFYRSKNNFEFTLVEPEAESKAPEKEPGNCCFCFYLLNLCSNFIRMDNSTGETLVSFLNEVLFSVCNVLYCQYTMQKTQIHLKIA